MPGRNPLCRTHTQGATLFNNSLDAGRYLAAIDTTNLPRPVHREDRVIRRGYAAGVGQWFFFPAVDPAVVFGRAARMSLDCLSCGVYEAAHETVHCPDHGDERVLHVNIAAKVDRGADEAAMLERFARGVREHPQSSQWNPPGNGARRDRARL